MYHIKYGFGHNYDQYLHTFDLGVKKNIYPTDINLVFNLKAEYENKF